ncbi:hypothetical protein FFI94_031780 [Rhodococcus sp. KBS0724]|uniref:MaoC/PaaZ C-terminal domain-containing protein n=1 Tax=Rhodococcus sp. KBS0724 TaxID=1179674 RepID=UPI00110EDEDB|nr:MaoC/PaaZ C-terminal domain-containing protein [Rhodococcus sp. KBS0724]TSD40325.1 hypothetical protein FFI94_031780 [Rhodococcus sp. KBS0724]
MNDTTANVAVPEVGYEPPSLSFGPVTRTDIVRYAGASGDFNPLHHDEHFARSSGFPTVFSMGMLQAAILAGYATDWLGAEFIRSFKVRFKEQVWPGDVLICSGVVTGVQPREGGVLVAVDLTCKRESANIAIAGSAEFFLPSEQIDAGTTSNPSLK